MTSLLLALALAGPALPEPPPSEETQHCWVAERPGSTYPLTLRYPEGAALGLWVDSTTVEKTTERIRVAELEAQRSRVPWWIWAVGGAVVGTAAGVATTMALHGR